MEKFYLEISRPTPSGYAGGPDLYYDNVEMTYEQFTTIVYQIEIVVDTFLKNNNIKIDK